jgi:hypothetical protein
MIRLVSTASVAIALAVSGCKSAGEAGASKPSANAPAVPEQVDAPKAPPAAQPATAPPTDKAEDASFVLAAVPAGPYAVGQLGSFAVSLTPRGEYHINQDYPIAISLKPAAGMLLPKAEFKKADAAVFTEQAARFDVPFTPEQKGAHRVEAHVRFAVCTPETCIPDERTLALVLPVE